MAKQWLGILLNDWEWKKVLQGSSKERVDLYIGAAKKYNLSICFFRLEDINIPKLRVKAFVRRKKRWKAFKHPLPSVIHNRAIYPLNKVKQLKKIRRKGIMIYNGWNNYSKLKIYNHLAQAEHLTELLPSTSAFSRGNLEEMCKKESFFVKPDRGSVGKGIIKLNKISSRTWRMLTLSSKGVMRQLVREQQLYLRLKKYIKGSKYILQETINLVELDQSPFDIRVSVQKNGDAKWQVTGLVAKKARKGHYLSNVAQGGSVVRIEDALQQLSVDVGTTIERIRKVALDIAIFLDEKLLNLADLGLDLGLDQTGRIYLIEVNSRDQRYSFRLADMKETFALTYDNTIAYGSYLLKQKAREKADLMQEVSNPYKISTRVEH